MFWNCPVLHKVVERNGFFKISCCGENQGGWGWGGGRKPARLASVFSQRLMGRNGLWFFIRLVQADVFLCKPKKKKKLTHAIIKPCCKHSVLKREEWLAIMNGLQLDIFRFSFRYHVCLVTNQWIFALILIFIVPIFSSSFYLLRFSITPGGTNSVIGKI